MMKLHIVNEKELSETEQEKIELCSGRALKILLRSSKNIVTNTRASGEYDLEQYAKECRTISACAYRSDPQLSMVVCSFSQ